jgi:hypothetical protein
MDFGLALSQVEEQKNALFKISILGYTGPGGPAGTGRKRQPKYSVKV